MHHDSLRMYAHIRKYVCIHIHRFDRKFLYMHTFELLVDTHFKLSFFIFPVFLFKSTTSSHLLTHNTQHSVTQFKDLEQC